VVQQVPSLNILFAVALLSVTKQAAIATRAILSLEFAHQASSFPMKSKKPIFNDKKIIPDCQLKDVCGFKVWALMLINNDDNFAVPDANTFIDFHGEGDGTYLVINVKTSKTSSIEYVFLAADEANEKKINHFDF
jgi:hypothetical protein